MPEEKTAAQELFEEAADPQPETVTIGEEQGEKPTLEGKSGETDIQKFEKEVFSTADSEGETPAKEKAESEPDELEKAKADAAFWQKQYQDFDGLLKEADPVRRDALNKQLRAKRKGKQTQEEPTEDTFKQATDAARADKLDVYENPEGFLNAIDKRLQKFEENIANRYQEFQDRSYQQAAWEQEAKAAETAVNNLRSAYKAELKLDDSTWKGVENDAWADVMDTLGITDDNRESFLGDLGAPTRVAKVFQKSLENRLLKHSYVNKVVQGQAEVASKVKAAQGVAQPTSQASPAPKPKSKADKIIEAIEGAAPAAEPRKELFGG